MWHTHFFDLEPLNTTFTFRGNASGNTISPAGSSGISSHFIFGTDYMLEFFKKKKRDVAGAAAGLRQGRGEAVAAR